MLGRELRTRCEPFFFKLFRGEQLSYFKGISGSAEIMGKNSLSFDCVPLFFFLKCLLKVYTFLKMSFKKFKLHNVITYSFGGSDDGKTFHVIEIKTCRV